MSSGCAERLTIEDLITISTRPEIPEDEPFLRRLLIDSISRQLHAEVWPPEIRESVLGLQYKIRREGSRSAFPGALSEIILVDGQPAGWVVTARCPDEIHLAEIMVSAERRGMGVASAIIREIVANAGRAGKPVRLTVSVANPRAVKLYERLGFHRCGADEANLFMERGPDPAAA